jgi:1-acyl-sn-glycerol-3-phosphate acyltransferase
VRRLEPWMRFAEVTLIPPIALWFKWSFEGLEHVPSEGGALVAGNHISYFDPLAHGYFLEKAGRRPRFLAKIELFRNKITGPVLRGAHQIPVVRGSGDVGPVDAALRALAGGELVVVYPESTVTTNEDFSPMRGKTGIARLSLSAGVPVIPLAVWGTAPVWQRGGKRDLKFGRPVWVKAGAPLDFSEHEERIDDPEAVRAVTDAVMAELTVLVDDMRARYPKEWA